MKTVYVTGDPDSIEAAADLCRSLSFNVLLAPDPSASDAWVQILKRLEDASIIVAVGLAERPSCTSAFWEIGYAVARGKVVIMKPQGELGAFPPAIEESTYRVASFEDLRETMKGLMPPQGTEANE